MSMVPKVLAACLLLASTLVCAAPELPASYPGQDVEHWFEVVSGLSGGGLAALDGQQFVFAVDLENDENFSIDVDTKGGKATLLYHMALNNVAESWAREPESEPARSEFKPFKSLPLKSMVEEKTPATADPGQKAAPRNLWRHDYFLAFDNFDDFSSDTGGALRAEIRLHGTAPDQEGVHVLALCRLKPPYFATSDTVWKATATKPVSLTVRRRYLMAELLEVKFYDYASGEVLARITRNPH
jgi:hypothetical protein